MRAGKVVSFAPADADLKELARQISKAGLPAPTDAEIREMRKRLAEGGIPLVKKRLDSEDKD